MERVWLFQFKSDEIRVEIEAYFEGENLIIEGYDIGETVKKYWGDSDYEYSTTVRKTEVGKLSSVLGVGAGDKEGLLKALAGKFNTNTCYSDFRNFLEKSGILAEGFSWT
jgi:hypothetical protein